MAVPIRTDWPASAPSPKKSPGVSIATTASLPIWDSTESLTAPFWRYLTSLPASPWAKTTSPGRYLTILRAGPVDLRYATTLKRPRVFGSTERAFGFRDDGLDSRIGRPEFTTPDHSPSPKGALSNIETASPSTTCHGTASKSVLRRRLELLSYTGHTLEHKSHEWCRDPAQRRGVAPRAVARARPAEGAHRNSRPRRGHARRVAERQADAGVRRSRLRQDAARPHFSREWCRSVRRARRAPHVRGERRRNRKRRRVPRLRSSAVGRGRKTGRRLCARGTQRDRGNGRVRPRGAVRQARPCHSDRGRQARRPRHHRIAVCGPEERHDPSLRAAEAVPVVEGPGGHRRDHGRARRWASDPARTRGIRLGCRDLARPSRPRSGLDAAVARGQVPRLPPRHQRVSRS